MICFGNEVELLQTKASSLQAIKASIPLMHQCTHALIYNFLCYNFDVS